MIGYYPFDLFWVVAFQSLGDGLLRPMKFFSYLGTEEFYLIVLPFLYWCIDAGLGLRVGVILLFSSGVNSILKIPFRGPRPYWVSAKVKPFWTETSFGIPSGHAQEAVAVWGGAAWSLRRRWAWWIAIAVMIMIGLSRAFLGAHFFLDVLAGWIVGCLLLWAFLRFWDPIADWVNRQTTGRKVTLAFLISLTMVVLGMSVVSGSRDYRLPEAWIQNAVRSGTEVPFPVSLSGILTSVGTLFGMLAGVAWMDSLGDWQVTGSWMKRVARYLVGLVGLAVLWYGLGEIFPRGEALLPYVLRFIRYALLGTWVSAGAPWLFKKIRLT